MKEITIKQATYYNIITKFGTMFIQLVISTILARLIIPEAFGIVAIMTIIVNFFNLFADMGIGIAIIQNDKLKKNDYDNVFSITIYAGIILCGLIICFSPLIALFYKNSVYKKLGLLISIIAFFNTINIVPNSLLLKYKRFDLIAYRSISANIFGGIIAIILALLGFSYYALIIQSIISSIFIFVWNYYNQKLKFRYKISLNSLQNTKRYSLFQFMFNILNYFTRNLDSISIGSFIGASQLGYYNKAYTLNLYPNQIFTSLISSLIHPYFRQYENNIDEMYRRHIRIIKILSIIGSYLTITTYFASNEIIYVLFGPQWNISAVCLQNLSISIWAQMISSTCGSIFLSLRRTDQTFKCGIINTVIIGTVLFFGIRAQSIYLISLLIGISYNIIFFITLYILICKTMKRSIKLVFDAIKYDASSIIIFILLVSCIKIDYKNIYLVLFIKVCIATLYYIIYLTISKQVKQIIIFIKNNIFNYNNKGKI